MVMGDGKRLTWFSSQIVMKRLNALPGTTADTAQAKAVAKMIRRIEEGMDGCSSSAFHHQESPRHILDPVAAI
jgi:hypothetical protein